MGHLLELDEVTTTLSELTGPSPWGSCPTREERALSGRFQQRRSSCTWENRPFHGARRLFFDFMRFPAAQRSASSRSHVRRGGLSHMGGISCLPPTLHFPMIPRFRLCMAAHECATPSTQPPEAPESKVWSHPTSPAPLLPCRRKRGCRNSGRTQRVS